jgi:hypothetical protein
VGTEAIAMPLTGESAEITPVAPSSKSSSDSDSEDDDDDERDEEESETDEEDNAQVSAHRLIFYQWIYADVVGQDEQRKTSVCAGVEKISRHKELEQQ